MVHKLWLKVIPKWLLELPEESTSPGRYSALRRNIIVLMVFVTIVPLLIMAVINYHQYQTALHREIVSPLRGLVNKTKHSLELFLAERLSTVSFIASAYTFQELSDEKTLHRIFRVTKQEFGGFVDLGLIDSTGVQIGYAGPYDLKGKNYSEQSWFHEVQIRGVYTSDVFMGYRKFPHIVMAVQRFMEGGQSWVLRATIDTEKFDNIIASMGLDPDSDAFLANRNGIFQTRSKFYGNVLEPCPLPITPISYEANVVEHVDPQGRKILLAYIYFVQPTYVLVVVKPKAEVLKSWYTLKSELFFVLLGSVLAIFLFVFRLTDRLVKRIRESDEKREAAFREMEHTHKLSSMGRLAAGVAHEINNPLAIINEKAGLMKDLLEYTPQFTEREKFLSAAGAILKSVNRCRTITHRLLGFARRMEAQIEVLDLNEVLKEVVSFVEKEALYRKIQLELNLMDNLPSISSDRGQLQQVFLNIINNAFEEIADGGKVTITTWKANREMVAVSIQDNGRGMSEDTLKSIFEPFFTTKKGYGTGLGLPITYGIVKKLGGNIEVESKKGEGAKFTVYLPKAASADSGGYDGSLESASGR
jgi:two-component system NtrC family sensor kinase